MPAKDEVSWNSLISGYVNLGFHDDRAVRAYKQMMISERRIRPNRITLSTMLVFASGRSSREIGSQIHSQIIKLGFESYVFVGSPLVDMYSKSGHIKDAKLVFDDMSEKNVVVYNTMITGLLRSGLVEESKTLFDSMSEKDSITWTTMITGFTQNFFHDEAIELFRQMRSSEVNMDQYTFGSVLTACGGLSCTEQGKQIHAYILRTNYDGNVFVGSALVDMYSKCKSLTYAAACFNKMPSKNIVSWTALLVGYSQNGLHEDAVNVFSEMQKDGGIDPDDFTLGSVISSCAKLAILEEGVQFHAQAVTSGLIWFVPVTNSLITLYGRCGSIEDANKVFDEMVSKDAISWTALLSVYAQFGKAKETIELFETMTLHQNKGLKPDAVTFISVLSACSRVGLVEKGCRYFKSMVEDHGINPTSDHYTCMIDLYGRVGRLEEAKILITNTEACLIDGIGWATLLSSCKIHGNISIGEWAAESLRELEPQNPASYVLLLNIYASKGMWEDVCRLRRTMRDLGLKKEPGCSWIKHENKFHIFAADDHSNLHSDAIYAKLEELDSKMVEMGYVPELSHVLHDVGLNEKKEMLSHHSEKLAIAFGLIFPAPGSLPIKVFKNLRVCGDCHTVTKYISKIVGREILVRDAARFHLFKDGHCSCGDFW